MHDEPAGERIEREQGREPQHHTAGAAQAEQRAGLGRRYLRGRGQTRKGEGEDDTECSIQEDNAAVVERSG